MVIIINVLTAMQAGGWCTGKGLTNSLTHKATRKTFTSGVKKPHRYKPGIVALRQIRY